MNDLKNSMCKKTVALLFCLGLTIASGGLQASASEEFDIQAQYEAGEIDSAFDELPDFAADDLQKAGIDFSDVSSVSNLNPAGVLASVISVADDEMEAPLAALGVIIALLLFAAVLKGGEVFGDSPLSESMNLVTSLAVGLIIVVPVASLVDSAGEATEIATRFTEAFGAIFAGLLVSNGQTASAAGYSAFLTGAINAASLCSNDVVMPMLRVFLALSCVSALSDSVRIDAVIRFFEKYAKWILGFTAALISTVLSISGIISASADSVGARAAKFVISGSVPVVGGAVSEAYLSIKSGMLLLRNSVGAFGIIATAYVFLPVIIRTLLWSMVAGAGEAMCDALKLGGLQKLMKSLSSALSLLMGLLVFAVFLLTLGEIVVIMQRSA